MFYLVSFIFSIFLLNFTFDSLAIGSNPNHGLANNTLAKRIRRSGEHDDDTKGWQEVEELIRKYPYMVGVIVRDTTTSPFNKQCTGIHFTSLRHVLTAASCVRRDMFNVEASSITLRYDSSRITRSGTTIGVKNVFCHPNYDAVSKKYDMAVLEAAGELKGEIVIAISRTSPDAVAKEFKKLQEARHPCTVVGFGIGAADPILLTAFQINLIPDEECKKMFFEESKKKLGDQFCAFKEQIDPCHGDGGAMLFCSTLAGAIGIFSHGEKCGRENGPVVFNRVDTQESFIDSSIHASRSTKSSGSYYFKPRLGLICSVLFFLGITSFETIN